MALDTYTDLLATVADWLNRRDLAAQIPDFIRLTEDDIATRLRDRRQEAYADATVVGQPVPLPEDWLEAIRITPAVGGRSLLPASLQQLQEMRANRTLYGVTLPPLPDVSGVGVGMRYAISGTYLEVWPLPVAPLTLSMVYLARVPRLSLEAPTNWLLREDAAIYLYGALAMSAPFLKDDARLTTWASLYTDRVNGRNAASDVAQFAGGPLRRTRRGFR